MKKETFRRGFRQKKGREYFCQQPANGKKRGEKSSRTVVDRWRSEKRKNETEIVVRGEEKKGVSVAIARKDRRSRAGGGEAREVLLRGCTGRGPRLLLGEKRGLSMFHKKKKKQDNLRIFLGGMCPSRSNPREGGGPTGRRSELGGRFKDALKLHLVGREGKNGGGGKEKKLKSAEKGKGHRA